MFSAEIDKRPAPHSTYVTDNESERLGVYNNSANMRLTKPVNDSANPLETNMDVDVSIDNISILPPKPHVTRRQHNKEPNLEKVNEEADY